MFLHFNCNLAHPCSVAKRKSAEQGGGAVEKCPVYFYGHFYFELQGAENVREEDSKPYPVGGCKEEEEECDNVEDFHSCGIGRFRLFEDTLICVDGQQRLTTTSLLVAAIRWFENMPEFNIFFFFRDKAKALGEDILCKEANAFLVSTEKETPMDSTIHSKLRLLPSQPDRWV